MGQGIDPETTLAEAIRARDAVEIVRALGTLDGPGEPQGVPAKLRDEAVQVLYQLIGSMPVEQHEAIFEVLDRARRTHAGAVDDDVLASASVAAGEESERARWWRTLIELLVDRAVLARHRTTIARGADPAALLTTCAALIALERSRSALAQQVRAQIAVRRRISLFREATAQLARNAVDLDDDDYDAMIVEFIRRDIPVDLPQRERSVRDEPRNLDLERAIHSQPEDVEAYAVFADWLSQHGHARGELIALQLSAETDPARATDVDEHIAAHAGALLGTLTPHRLTHDDQVAPAFTWRRGFIDRARLRCAPSSFDNNALREDDILDLLLEHPSARCLSALEIVTDLIEVIPRVITRLAQSTPPTLRVLKLAVEGMNEREPSGYIASIANLWTRLPRLRELELRGRPIDLGVLDHGHLERLAIGALDGLPADALQTIAAARLPGLRELDLSIGLEPRAADYARLTDVCALLERVDLPALTRLGIHTGYESRDALCTSLAASRLASQIEVLDLSRNALGPHGAARLLASRQAFPRLTILDVSNALLNSETLVALRDAFPRVIGEPREVRPSPLELYLSRRSTPGARARNR